MTRYFFDVRNGPASATDDDGLECSSLDAAEGQAVLMLGTIVACELDEGGHAEVDIRAGDGRVSSTVALRVTTSRRAA